MGSKRRIHGTMTLAGMQKQASQRSEIQGPIDTAGQSATPQAAQALHLSKGFFRGGSIPLI